MSLMTTLEEKRAYFNRVKLANFRESSRLEGYGPALTIIPQNNKELDQAKKSILNRYRNNMK